MNLIDLIFPKSCLECKKEGKYFCDNCLSKIRPINSYNFLTQTFSIFPYTGVIRKGIIKIKYNFAYDIANELSDICAKEIRKSIYKSLPNNKNCILMPIPLHESRKKWRGFNQSEILGKKIAEKLKIEFKNDILYRKIQGKNQVGLKAADRARNIRGKFAVNLSALNPKADFTYIIFDDVATTGSTIKEAIREFKKRGFKNVFGLTVALN